MKVTVVLLTGNKYREPVNTLNMVSYDDVTDITFLDQYKDREEVSILEQESDCEDPFHEYLVLTHSGMSEPDNTSTFRCAFCDFYLHCGDHLLPLRLDHEVYLENWRDGYDTTA